MRVFHARDSNVEMDVARAGRSPNPIEVNYGGKTQMLISFMHILLDRKREFETISQPNPAELAINTITCSRSTRLIHALFIIKQGISVFSQTYEIKLDVSKDLLAGFLSALPAFAKEIEEDQTIEGFKMSEYTFVFKPLKNSSDPVGNFMVLLADSKDKEDTVRKVLDILVEEFTSHFKLDDWNSNLDIFKPFKELADKVLFNRERKPLELSPNMIETISETIAESKYNFLILNKDNDIVLTSLKRVSKSFTADTINDIKDAIIQYSVFPPVIGSKLETSFINTDKMLVIYDKILDSYFIAFMMKDEQISGPQINAYEMVKDVFESLDEIKFTLMTFFVGEQYQVPEPILSEPLKKLQKETSEATKMETVETSPEKKPKPAKKRPSKKASKK